MQPLPTGKSCTSYIFSSNSLYMNVQRGLVLEFHVDELQPLDTKSAEQITVFPLYIKGVTDMLLFCTEADFPQRIILVNYYSTRCRYSSVTDFLDTWN